jgi:hypothetical protein
VRQAEARQQERREARSKSERKTHAAKGYRNRSATILPRLVQVHLRANHEEEENQPNVTHNLKRTRTVRWKQKREAGWQQMSEGQRAKQDAPRNLSDDPRLPQARQQPSAAPGNRKDDSKLDHKQHAWKLQQ